MMPMRFRDRVLGSGGDGMTEELLHQVAELLADGLEGEGDDLDSMENALIPMLREVGRRALQRRLEGKKRATQAAASSVHAAKTPGSSAIAPSRSKQRSGP
jgi:hypothetical protein